MRVKFTFICLIHEFSRLLIDCLLKRSCFIFLPVCPSVGKSKNLINIVASISFVSLLKGYSELIISGWRLLDLRVEKYFDYGFNFVYIVFCSIYELEKICHNKVMILQFPVKKAREDFNYSSLYLAFFINQMYIML